MPTKNKSVFFTEAFAKGDNSIESRIAFYLENILVINPNNATVADYYRALAYSVKERLNRNWMIIQDKYERTDTKMVNYLSLEYLMGRVLTNALINMGLYKDYKKIMDKTGQKLDDILNHEEDIALGNGGLGRLAACFMDSMATMKLPAFGYGLRYEFGSFKQNIINGYQVEQPNNWLTYGNPWEVIKPDTNYRVRLFGESKPYYRDNGDLAFSWENTYDVLAIAYDLPIPGYANDIVNTLRLWQAKSSDEFNFLDFHKGYYYKAIQGKTHSEMISKMLYPNDNMESGRELRLKQQYFFVSATLQDIIVRYRKNNNDFNKFHLLNAIQLNDTHPALAIPELIRILIDEIGMPWETAWDIAYRTFSYTNHTILSEALEKWDVSLFKSLLPRHKQIIDEINHRFLDNVKKYFTRDEIVIRDLSVYQEKSKKKIRMANLSLICSHKINGVAEQHTEILKNRIFKNFHEFDPQKFISITNGVAQRRWLLEANPLLSGVITKRIGDGWITDLSQLKKLEDYAEDRTFVEEFRKSRMANKERLAEYIENTNGIEVDPNTIFDVQIKRIHEYKRQLLNVLHIVTHYNRLKDNPRKYYLPRTMIFAGKAAPSYYPAKVIIKLINAVANEVNNDPKTNNKLKVVFLKDYSVSLAEMIIPAADVSEQISTAGFEASGTSNMKMMLNGAVTIGTLDGANIEIMKEVGKDNIFTFGMNAEEIFLLKKSGYNPYTYYERNLELKKLLDMIKNNYFSQSEPGIFNNLIDCLIYRKDDYMLLADYDTYIKKQEELNDCYKDQSRWSKMAILNIARSGYFSSDRSVMEYAKKIWGLGV